MARPFVGGAYSGRAWLVALFLVFAIVLGGGGSPNPTTELLLEVIFAISAAVWLWLPRGTASDSQIDPLVIMLVAVPLVIPVVQLIPLPPGVWSALPARQDQADALALVGSQGSWRPISLSPARTFASLLAIVPAVACTYAVARLDLHERRLVLATIVLMVLATCVLGALQLVAGARGLNLYSQFHVGWVTGFQANRNATADILLIGLLALIPLAAPYLDGTRQPLPLSFDRRAFSFLVGALGLIIAVALVMTGSRAGIALLVIPIGAALFAVTLSGKRSGLRRHLWLYIAAVAAAALFAVYLLAFSQHTALGRVAFRFWSDGAERGDVWQDAWFALKQYWPFGFGLGGFESAILAFERLEAVNPALPNRAHNEYLEIGLEAGLLGYAMVAAAAAVSIALAWRAWRSAPGMRRQILFGAGVLIIISLHSVVDYPLRSMALACLCGVAGGMLARKRAQPQQSNPSRRDEVTKGLG
jgi:O-antigen ligase